MPDAIPGTFNYPSRIQLRSNSQISSQPTHTLADPRVDYDKYIEFMRSDRFKELAWAERTVIKRELGWRRFMAFYEARYGEDEYPQGRQIEENELVEYLHLLAFEDLLKYGTVKTFIHSLASYAVYVLGLDDPILKFKARVCTEMHALLRVIGNEERQALPLLEDV